MNKLTFIAVAAIVCIVSAAVYAGFKPAKDNALPTQTTKKTASMPQPPARTESSPQTQPGAYEAYSADKVAATAGTSILFFHAPWCPQCRKLENDIKASGVPDGVTIFKVDYDSSQDLRKKYGVTIQTTLIKLDNQGNLAKKYVAYDKPTLANVAANLLE